MSLKDWDKGNGGGCFVEKFLEGSVINIDENVMGDDNFEVLNINPG